MAVDREFRFYLLGLIRAAEFELAEAVAALEPDTPPNFATCLTVAAGHIAEAQIAWKEQKPLDLA